MKQHRLLWQLFSAILLITLVSILLISWFGSLAIRNFYFQQMEHGLESRAYLIRDQVSELIQSSHKDLQDFSRHVGRRASTRITIILPDGTVLADSNESPAKMNNHANRPELITALEGKTGSSTRFSRTLGQNMLYVAIPLTGKDENLIGAIRLSVSTESLDEVLSSINKKVLLACVLVTIAAALLALFVSRRISRPLEEMKRSAEKIASGEMNHSLNIESANVSLEVSALASSLKKMAVQIDQRLQTITLQRNELETVFSSMTEMVMAIDQDKKILRMNRSAAALFYLSPDDIKGKHIHGVIRNDELHKLVDSVFETGKMAERDIILYVGPDRLHLQTRAVPLQDENKNPMGVLVVLNDMTRLHKLENLRREFVANVSHELKTPVTSISGYVETLLDGAIDDKNDAKRFLEIISRQTTRLNSIIDDLLMLSRIEQKTEKSDISLSRIQLRNLIDSTIQNCQKQALEKEITIKVHCDETIYIEVNPNLIEQALINLITNAITYSGKGSTIDVSAFLDNTSQTEKITISVKDEGIGIAQEHLDRLFERFYRCDKGRSKELGGTGLGLSIVKHIAMVHGGSVGVESQPGKGSVFSIYLPS